LRVLLPAGSYACGAARPELCGAAALHADHRAEHCAERCGAGTLASRSIDPGDLLCAHSGECGPALPQESGLEAMNPVDLPDNEMIRTIGLTRTFGKERIAAVDGLDLSVHKGEIFGLVGPDGSGKTTTLRLLAAIMDPTAG